jgi:hypothetical protein
MRSIACIFLIMPIFGWGQNLVPNPSFEEYEECPLSTAELALQTNWESWQETPDYFNECNNVINGNAGVPENSWGYQLPITGVSYMALATYANYAPDIREYAAVPLTMPLIIGQEYRVFFYASLYDGGVKSDARCATNHIGLRFFKNPEYNNLGNPLQPDNFAHIDYDLVIADSDNWTFVEGWFIADDNYNWLAIGNFFDGENTTVEVLNALENYVAYYYIENICVSSTPEDCNILLMSEEIRKEPILKVLSNPFFDDLIIQNERHSKLVISVFDTIGQLVATNQGNKFSFTFETTTWQKGLYFLVARDENDNIQTIKILKQ